MSQELSGVARSIPAKKPQSVNPKKRCSNSVFPAMSVAHVDDDDGGEAGEGPGDSQLIEKTFPNGDIYTGEWSDDADRPHGRGKYLWSDGCMYAGEWSEGKTLGRGRFSWPSGATYEGRFKNGYMDGEGTYIGSTGDTYRGAWARNTFHGGGARSYANGDFYTGRWRRSLPDGRGRYTWRNGDQYTGQWRQGRMHGAGTMTWAADGTQYDGSWRQGLPRGNGTFRWPDGSFYVGVWSEDHTEQTGTYYPCNSPVINGFDSNDWNPQEVYLVRLRDCRVSVGEKIPIFPSQKTTNWGLYDRSNGNNVECSLESDLSCNECSGSDREEFHGIDTVRKYRRWPRMRRQGHTILKGHKNYELMLNLQLGIRHSVGRPSPSSSLDLKGSSSDTRDKTWMRFPPEGSKHTPPHQSCEFKWKDYCPSVFRTLRKLFKVDPADYMISICGDDALRELSSPGKSGSFFYLTDDDKYMIKTMKKSEVRVLKRMLPSYYNHVSAFEDTLVTKFFGLHCVRMSGSGQKKVRFVVMGNLFCTEYAIHRRFDLKGSSHGRITVKPETKIDSTTTLKDLDLNLTFRMHRTRFQDFQMQLDRDCEFLERERIMDYSLLVGIHFRELSPSGEPRNRGRTRPVSTEDLNHRFNTNRLGCNVPARAEASDSEEYYDVVLVFGIIDILQDYDISKKLEHAYKSFQYDSSSISAVDPRQYSRRFRDFIFRVFGGDD